MLRQAAQETVTGAQTSGQGSGQ